MVGTPIKVIENFFYLNIAYNQGAAWGILSGKIEFFFIITILVVGVILYTLFTSNNKSGFLRFALVLCLTGTLGNFYDRLLFSRVRDFLDFYIFGYDYPIFNFADIYLTFGFIFLALYFIKHPEDFEWVRF